MVWFSNSVCLQLVEATLPSNLSSPFFSLCMYVSFSTSHTPFYGVLRLEARSLEKCQRSLRVTVGISSSRWGGGRWVKKKDDIISPPSMLSIRQQGRLLKNIIPWLQATISALPVYPIGTAPCHCDVTLVMAADISKRFEL